MHNAIFYTSDFRIKTIDFFSIILVVKILMMMMIMINNKWN